MKSEKRTPSREDIPSNILNLPILQKEEEVELFRELDAIRVDLIGPDRDAWFTDENRLKMECMSSSRDPGCRRIRAIRDRIVEGCTRYTYYTVRKMARVHSIPFIEQFQEGLLGVIEAIFRYDTRVASRFQSFASWVIRTHVRQYRLVNAEFMKTPSRVAEIRRFLYHYKEDVRSAEEVKAAMDAKYAYTTPLVTIEQALLSYRASSEIHSEDVDVPIYECVADPDDNVEEQAAESEMAENIRRLLSRLKPAQIRVISEKFGLDTGEERTNIEISRDMNLTRERIRQVENKALATLRNMMEWDAARSQAVSCVTNPEGGHHDEFSRRHFDRTHRGRTPGRRVSGLLGV